jgi:hypothetical protein
MERQNKATAVIINASSQGTGMTVGSAQHEAEYQALCAVARAARELVDECLGGTYPYPPSLGALAKLESALNIDWKIRYLSRLEDTIPQSPPTQEIKP